MKSAAHASIRGYQLLMDAFRRLQVPVFWYSTCKFHPSCSEYSTIVIERDGLMRVGLKSLWRIMRCNPLSAGRVDLP